MTNETIDQLQQDIAAMQTLVLWYENRILCKQTAIEEIIQSAMSPMSVDLASMPQAAKPEPQVEIQNLSVPQLVATVLPAFNGCQIIYADLRQQVVERYPQSRAKIDGGFYRCCLALIDKGTHISMPQQRRRPAKVQ